MAQQSAGGYEAFNPPSYGYVQDPHYDPSSGYGYQPSQPPPIPNSSLDYGGYSTSYGQEQYPTPKYQPIGSYGAIGDPVKPVGMNPQSAYDGGQFMSPPPNTSWQGYDYGSGTSQYGAAEGTFDQSGGYDNFSSQNNFPQADGLGHGISSIRGRPATRGNRGRGGSQQGYEGFEATDGYSRGGPEQSTRGGSRGQYGATRGTGRGRGDGRDRSVGYPGDENVGRGQFDGGGRGKFDSRGGGHFDRGSRGRGQFDSGSRGRGLSDRGNRGRGQFDAARGRAQYDSGNRGRGQYNAGNRGRGNFDGGNLGRGQFGANRGRGQSDVGSRGRGLSDGGSRGRGLSDRENRGRGQFGTGNRGRGYFNGSRGRGWGQEGLQDAGEGGTRGRGQEGSRGRGTRGQAQTWTRGRGQDSSSTRGQHGGTWGRGQQAGTRGRGQSDVGRGRGRGGNTSQSGTKTPKPFKMTTDIGQGFISYKNNLQEYCQKNHKPVPQYTSQKADIGYTACVTVDEQMYSCLQSQREKKDAEQAAAFEALKAMGFIDTNAMFTPKVGTAKKRPSGEADAPHGPEIKIAKKDEPTTPQPTIPMQSFKSKLNELCQKLRCDLPSYSTVRTSGGFLSTVVLNGQVHQGVTTYGTKKLAEQHVAEILFNQMDSKTGTNSAQSQVSSESLDTDLNTSDSNIEQSTSAVATSTPNSANTSKVKPMKNIVQEYCQKNGWQIPIYNTIKDAGLCIATVTVNGVDYVGTPHIMKKTAEQNAAKKVVEQLGLK